jgi:hypothetical protein
MTYLYETNCMEDYKTREDAMLKNWDETDWVKHGLLHEGSNF